MLDDALDLRKTALTAHDGRSGLRILLYSHDTFGLGHIRRSRAIALALAEGMPDASILIVTGSPIVGRFDFAPGVDFVRIPGVVKLPSGDYASHAMPLDISETVALRQNMIAAAATSFSPDLVVVDKEPTGFRGELLPTLEAMKEKGARIVLGVRDVLDAPDALTVEWERKEAMSTIERFYDELWVYGLEEIYSPLAALDLSDRVRERIRYTGYLRRHAADDWPDIPLAQNRPDGYVLVTPGGGGDGAALIDWVLRAYEAEPSLSVPAVIVFGPFLNSDQKSDFQRRAHRFRTIETLSFDSRIERLMIEACGIIAMGGYNTFCEILSFDKPACIAPRITPRREQYIRAERAEAFGLIKMLPSPEASLEERDPLLMAAAIRDLARQPKPSAAKIAGLLDGLDVLVGLASDTLRSSRA